MTISKRSSNPHKNALGKVNQHLKLAKSAHGRGMASLAECAKCMVDAKKLGKAAEGDDLASHLAAAHGQFGKAADHHGRRASAPQPSSDAFLAG